jgi:hypothetical protein
MAEGGMRFTLPPYGYGSISGCAQRSKILLTDWFFIAINLTGRNAGIYTKEAPVSSGNLPLSQGDCHPALPIISFHHLSRPHIAFAISFHLDL